MDKRPVLVAAFVVATWLLSAGCGGSDPTRPGDTFWWDEGTNELFPESAGKTSPITAPSGSDGFRARVYAEGSCDNAADRFIGYLERHPDLEALQQTFDANRIAELMAESQIRRPDDGDWVYVDEEEGVAIHREFATKTANGELQACLEYRK